MESTDQYNICELVRRAENDYISGTTNISKYVQFSQFENIEKIDAYLNSKHVSGDTDSMGRDKPFFNIVTAAVNIWYRATDIDRKNIKIKADSISQYLAAFVASIHLQEWMRRNKFGAFLNEWGRSLARYGSSVVKFVEKDGELSSNIIPWNRIISDTVDFENNPKIEILWMTPAQLRKNKAYDQTIVEKLLDTKAIRENTDHQTKDNRSEYIKLYEVHGELENSYLTGIDDDTYTQQMHVISFLANKEDGSYDDFTLYKGREAKDPYMLTHLLKEDGRAQAIGAVEYLFEAQWMVNHSQKAIKDQLDLASKLIFQTSDGNFVGQNVLSAIETGDILIHKQAEPLTKIDNDATDIASLQNFSKQWEVLAQGITSTPDAMRGESQPAGTAWRQVEALRAESHSLFELMTEEKGLHIEDMMREYVIPYIKKQMDTTDELSATLDSVSLTQFDSMYVPNEAIRRDNQQIKKTILSGQVAQNQDPQELQGNIKKELSNTGTQRFIKPSDLDNVTWKDKLKDLEWEVSVDVTSEETDKDAIVTTLTTVLKTVATNPSILEDPNMKLLFNKILEQTNAVSPLEMVAVAPQGPPQNKIIETMSYKDTPPDVQRQIEAQAGLKPSQGQPVTKQNGNKQRVAA